MASGVCKQQRALSISISTIKTSFCRNLNLLTEESWLSKTQLPSPFYCSYHPSEVISHHINTLRLF